MTFEVELRMFMEGQIRKVDVPDDELTGRLSDDLEKIFFYGQNDFQRKPLCSVSMGDVVRFKGDRYQVMSAGFKKLKQDECTDKLIWADQIADEFARIVDEKGDKL